jgi:hypothetical protein
LCMLSCWLRMLVCPACKATVANCRDVIVLKDSGLLKSGLGSGYCVGGLIGG